MTPPICEHCGRLRPDYAAKNRHRLGVGWLHTCCDCGQGDPIDRPADDCDECNGGVPSEATFTISGLDASVCGLIICENHLPVPPAAAYNANECHTNLQCDGTHSLDYSALNCEGSPAIIGTVDHGTLAKPDISPCPAASPTEYNLVLELAMHPTRSAWAVYLYTWSGHGGIDIWYFYGEHAIGVNSCYSDFTVENELECLCRGNLGTGSQGLGNWQGASGGTVRVNWSA